MNQKLLCLTLLLAVSSCTPSDPACNPTNCELLLGSCHTRLPGAVDETCLDLATSQDGGMEEWSAAASQSCVNACNQDGQGPLFTCVAQRFPGDTCMDIALDAGAIPDEPTAAIAAACIPDAGSCGPSCQACQQRCESAQAACNSGCAAKGSVLSSCLACNFECNQQLVQCANDCPQD